ncbi:hypothetical protein C0J52_23111 [Blattella germanica]|nr:hypothetical protein C0J52_23111 [Blattella germanica]
MRLALFIAVTQSALTSHHKKIVLKVGKCTGQKLDANVVQLVCRTKLSVLTILFLFSIGEIHSKCHIACIPEDCTYRAIEDCTGSGNTYYFHSGGCNCGCEFCP